MARDCMEIGIISDWHKRILATILDKSVGWTAPYGYQKLCFRHIEANLNGRFHDAIFLAYFYQIAKQNQSWKFDRSMQHIETTWPNYFQYLKSYPLDDLNKWLLVHDMTGYRYKIMNTNLSESFNKMLKETHCLLPLLFIFLSNACRSGLASDIQ